MAGIDPARWSGSISTPCGAPGAADAAHMPAEVASALALLKTHRVAELRRAFGQAIARDGLGRFVLEVAAPMTSAVGDLWMRGALEVFEEHLFTESLTVVLRNAIVSVPQSQSGPRILLTTFPNEQHGLGLLMAEAMLALEGAQCISLGVETPIGDILRAVAAQATDIVALSFSQAYPAAQAVAGLGELRRALAARIEVWVGGGSEALARRLPDGVLAMRRLANVGTSVQSWRARAEQ
jgi:methanogenic corrinoid protein MtbC1